MGTARRSPARPGLNLLGYGHYHETYEKVDGRWYIKSSKLTRLREDISTRSSRFGFPSGCAMPAGPWCEDAPNNQRRDYPPEELH